MARFNVVQLNEARAAKQERRARGLPCGKPWRRLLTIAEQAWVDAGRHAGMSEMEIEIEEIVQSLVTQRQNEDEMLELYLQLQLNAEEARGEKWEEIPF